MEQPSQFGGTWPEWTTADRLIKARRFAGLTQEQLSERLGIGARSIKRYETGRPAKRGILIAWAYACGVSIEWMLGEEGDEGTPPDIREVTERYVTAAATAPFPAQDCYELVA